MSAKSLGQHEPLCSAIKQLEEQNDRSNDSPTIHKKKVKVSMDDVSPVPPADDSLLIDQTIMDEEPGRRRTVDPHQRFLKVMLQLEVSSVRARNLSHQITSHVILVINVAHQYDLLMTCWARCHIYALFKQVNCYSQVLSCNNHLPIDIHTRTFIEDICHCHCHCYPFHGNISIIHLQDL